MKRFLTAAAVPALLIASGLASSPAIFAQAPIQTPGVVDVSRVTAGTYTLDPAHTLVHWQVDHFGFNDYFGLFGNISGTMRMDPDDISAANFEIMIPIAEVTVASEGLKEHLLRSGKDGESPDFFGPEPGMAKFTSTSVRQESDTTAVVSGILEMNGNTGPVTMLVEFTGAGTNPFSKKETVGFHARATIDRTDWDINYGQGLIGNKVDLLISAAFEKQ